MTKPLNDYPSAELTAALFDRLCYEGASANLVGDEILTFARDEGVRLVRQEAREQLKQLRRHMAEDERAYRESGFDNTLAIVSAVILSAGENA